MEQDRDVSDGLLHSTRHLFRLVSSGRAVAPCTTRQHSTGFGQPLASLANVVGAGCGGLSGIDVRDLLYLDAANKSGNRKLDQHPLGLGCAQAAVGVFSCSQCIYLPCRFLLDLPFRVVLAYDIVRKPLCSQVASSASR